MSDAPIPESLVELWRGSCARHGSSVLLESGEEVWTYGELFDSSRRVSSWLRRNGLEPGGRVVILLGNGPAYVASYFGVLAAGGVVVALNPTAAAAERAAAIAHSTPSAAIAEASREHDVRSLPRIIVGQGAAEAGNHARTSWQGLAQLDPLDADVEAATYRVAQIVYTSGTSGRPKGVVLSHRNLCANTRSILGYLRLVPGDSVLAILPFYYSYGNSVLLTHVAVGGRLVLSDFVFVGRALDVIEEKGVTGFAGVPASFSALVHHSNFAQRTFRTLRYLTCAGGALAESLVDQVVAAQPRLDLHVMYGQTEASPRLSSLPPADVVRKRGSAGRAIPGMSLVVRDASGEVCAAGVTGEIYATGPSVMEGYWNDPDATAAALTPHGLRTGDLGHIDDEGYLYVEGRLSGVIKSGGYRISPEEIEAVLIEMEAIESVAVAGEPDEQLGEAITAFVQLRPDAREDAEAIIGYSKRVLPRHKQVRRVVFVRELPRTSNGKLWRSRLVTSGALSSGTMRPSA